VSQLAVSDCADQAADHLITQKLIQAELE